MVLSYVSLISFGPITVFVGRMSLNSSQHETLIVSRSLAFLFIRRGSIRPICYGGKGARPAPAMGQLFFWIHSPLNKLSTILSTTTTVVLLFD